MAGKATIFLNLVDGFIIEPNPCEAVEFRFGGFPAQQIR